MNYLILYKIYHRSPAKLLFCNRCASIRSKVWRLTIIVRHYLSVLFFDYVPVVVFHMLVLHSLPLHWLNKLIFVYSCILYAANFYLFQEIKIELITHSWRYIAYFVSRCYRYVVLILDACSVYLLSSRTARISNIFHVFCYFITSFWYIILQLYYFLYVPLNPPISLLDRVRLPFKEFYGYICYIAAVVRNCDC